MINRVMFRRLSRETAMNKSRIALVVSAGLLIGLSIWATAETPPPAPAEKPQSEPTRPFHRELLKIAAEYKNWGRVDDEMRWAPTFCRMPMPGRAYVSASSDEPTHGRKLYSLLTKQRKDYLQLAKDKPVPVGFAIVKQSWLPEEVTDPKPKEISEWLPFDSGKVITMPGPKEFSENDPFAILGDHFYPYAKKGDKVFKAAKQADLFVMMKLDPSTPDTDHGWVYGTLTPDGKKVTAAGKLESCMKCHLEAKSDRLFGLVR